MHHMDVLAIIRGCKLHAMSFNEFACGVGMAEQLTDRTVRSTRAADMPALRRSTKISTSWHAGPRVAITAE